jgi:hypothetical protein
VQMEEGISKGRKTLPRAATNKTGAHFHNETIDRPGKGDFFNFPHHHCFCAFDPKLVLQYFLLCAVRVIQLNGSHANESERLSHHAISSFSVLLFDEVIGPELHCNL